MSAGERGAHQQEPHFPSPCPKTPSHSHTEEVLTPPPPCYFRCTASPPISTPCCSLNHKAGSSIQFNTASHHSGLFPPQFLQPFVPMLSSQRGPLRSNHHSHSPAVPPAPQAQLGFPQGTCHLLTYFSSSSRIPSSPGSNTLKAFVCCPGTHTLGIRAWYLCL